ncbi:hypothetical protein PInf_010392 [Phytophthora infestans]|nr:hypothetical protein PInf_010392 [Phytophthora infestans]
MFVHPGDVAPTKGTKRKAATGESVHESRRPLRRQRMVGLEGSDSDAEPTMMQTPDDEDDQDKREVQRQNHILNAIGGGPIHHAELGTYAVDEMRSNTTTTFRPTTIEKDIHDKIGHPNHQGLVLAESLISAMRIKDELSLHDPLLAELLYDEQKTMIATLKAQLGVKPTSNARPYSGSRETRQTRARGIPKYVLQLMPKQGALSPVHEVFCFSTKRAHFRPKTLPEPVKQHIIKNFGGSAPEFADL